MTRAVIPSLLIGIGVGELLLASLHPVDALTKTIEDVVKLLSEAWILKSLLFAMLIGAILTLTVQSGGVGAFVSWLTQKKGLVQSKRGALLLGYLLGIVIFIESTITSLVVGAITRPLAGRFGASPAKVSYLCDATSAPVCSLLPLNGWGALLLVLITSSIAAQNNITPLEILIASLPYNLYAIATLVVLLAVIITGRDVGPMAKSEQRFSQEQIEHDHALLPTKITRISDMLWPIGWMLALTLIYLWIDGSGNMLKGSGTNAIFYAVISTIFLSWLYYVIWVKRFSNKEFFTHVKDGVVSMSSMGLILLLAFGLAAVIKELETGRYLASLITTQIPSWALPALLFAIAALTSFATGTSWGTFSIMVPIGIDIAFGGGLSPALMVGAAVAGGVFGDHCSPISDTTIISSMAAGCDHIEHVRTQLPYALLSALFALVGYLLIGWLKQ